MRRLRRIGMVLLVLAVLLVAWEPSRVAMQTAVLLPNLLDAGPKPLNLFSAAPRRSSVAYRPTESGRRAGPRRAVASRVGLRGPSGRRDAPRVRGQQSRSQPPRHRARGRRAGPDGGGGARPRLADAARGTAGGGRDRRRGARLPAAGRTAGGRSVAAGHRRLQCRRLARAARIGRPPHQWRRCVG